MKKYISAFFDFIHTDLVQKTFITLLGFSTRLGIKAVFFIIIARVLGPTEYGTFAAVIALCTIISPYVSWGSGNILVKNTSRNRNVFSDFFGAALTLSIISGILFSIILTIIFSIFIQKTIPPLVIFAFVTAELIFGRIVDVCVMSFLAFEQMRKMTRLQINSSFLLLISAIILLFTPSINSLSVLSVLYLLSFIFSSVLALFHVYKELGWGRFSLKPIIPELREGFFFAASTSTQAIYNDADKTILPIYTSTETAGYYSAAYRILNLLYVPITALMYSAYPKFFIKGKNGIKQAKTWATKVQPIAATYGLISLLILSLGASTITLILGDSYANSAQVLIFLSPLILLKSLNSFPGDALTGSGFQGLRTLLQAIISVINIISNFVLIPVIGWKGAAVSSLLSDGLLALFLWIAVWIVEVKGENNN